MTRIKKLTLYWQTASDKDFKSAKNIFESTKEYVNVLFLIHLSIEKALKAYYVHLFKQDAPFSHNLLQLSLKCGINLSPKQLSSLTEINEFNIRCRYPDESFSIYKLGTKVKVFKYINFTEEFRKWIFQKLN